MNLNKFLSENIDANISIKKIFIRSSNLSLNNIWYSLPNSYIISNESRSPN